MVTDAMNEHLTQDFHADEVHQALKQMHPKKSPRPDGMPPPLLSTLLVFIKWVCNKSYSRLFEPRH